MKENLIKRSCTTVFLIAGLASWMFIGAVYLTPILGNKPDWSAYTFMSISSILLIVALMEIINLRKQLKWSWGIKIFILFMGLICLWFPLGNENFGLYLYNKNWFNPWMNIAIYCLFILILFAISFGSKKFMKEDILFVLVWTIYLVITFKGVNYMMLQSNGLQQLGWPTLLYLWVIVMSSDMGAYFGGMLWGKRPLAPTISPKKTWEGAISGFVISMILSIITITLLLEVGKYNPLPLYEGSSGKAPVYIAYIGITVILSVVSQFGDLLFSYLKRNHNVKDFSHIFPGHGGLLDRLDSFSAVAFLSFFICLLLIS